MTSTSTNQGFNMLTHPWIPIVTDAGNLLTVGLLDLFSKSQLTLDLVEESRIKHALYLFLIAIAHESAFQQLKQQPHADNLPKRRADCGQLQQWCLAYLNTSAAQDAFQDDLLFLVPDSIPKNAEYKPITWSGKCLNSCKDGDKQNLTNPRAFDTPERCLRNWFGIQCFYGGGPDVKSTRTTNIACFLLLGANLSETLLLNLRRIELPGGKSKDLPIGRAAWTLEGKKDWKTSTIGNLTPLACFIQRESSQWKQAVVKSEKHDHNIDNAPLLDGFLTPEGKPLKIPQNRIWGWKAVATSLEGLTRNSIPHDNGWRNLSVRITAHNKAQNGINLTTEKTYHLGWNPNTVATLQRAAKIAEMLLAYSKTLRTQTDLKKREGKSKPQDNKYNPDQVRFILNVSIAIETTWEVLEQITDQDESIAAWKKLMRNEIVKACRQIPVSPPTGGENDIIMLQQFKYKLLEILKTETNPLAEAKDAKKAKALKLATTKKS